ncbi:MAG: hypothetical protein HC904_10875 [Blastochloris sp.]|nr:hypothetical protein [Blastochloris sp.]
MKKAFLLFSTVLATSSFLALADVGDSSASTGVFRGTITAVETERDSFTVENADKQVKMFSVSPSRKDKLSVGQTVSVSYVEDYQWPLKTTSISTSMGK